MATLVQEKKGVSGIKLRIDQQVFRIGRGDENELSIDDELVSKLHAIIEAVADPEQAGEVQYYIQDQQSTNHTYVNGEQISLYKLSNNDLIEIGVNHFRFVDDAHDDLDETTRIQKSWIPGIYYAKKSGKKASRKKKKK